MILFFPVPEQTDNCTEGGERQQTEDLWTGFFTFTPKKLYDQSVINSSYSAGDLYCGNGEGKQQVQHCGHFNFNFDFDFFHFHFCFEQYDIYSLRLVEESVSDKARIKWWVGSWSRDSLWLRSGIVMFVIIVNTAIGFYSSWVSSPSPSPPPPPAWRCLQASWSRGARSFKEPWRRQEAKRG